MTHQVRDLDRSRKGKTHKKRIGGMFCKKALKKNSTIPTSQKRQSLWRIIRTWLHTGLLSLRTTSLIEIREKWKDQDGSILKLESVMSRRMEMSVINNDFSV